MSGGEEKRQEAHVLGNVAPILQRPAGGKRAMGGGPAEEATGWETKPSRDLRRHALQPGRVEDAFAQTIGVAEGIGGLISRVTADALRVDGQPAARAMQNVVVMQVAVQRRGRNRIGEKIAGDAGGCGKVSVKAGAGQGREAEVQGFKGVKVRPGGVEDLHHVAESFRRLKVPPRACKIAKRGTGTMLHQDRGAFEGMDMDGALSSQHLKVGRTSAFPGLAGLQKLQDGGFPVRSGDGPEGAGCGLGKHTRIGQPEPDKGLIKAHRQRLARQAARRPAAAISAMPVKPSASGSCWNTSQPSRVAKAMCR